MKIADTRFEGMYEKFLKYICNLYQKQPKIQVGGVFMDAKI